MKSGIGRLANDLQPHAVIGGYHALGQALPQHLVVQIGMHVGDDGALRLEAIDPGQRVADAEMAGMVRIAQAVDNPEVEIFEVRPAHFRNIADVGRVGGGAYPIAERRDVSMRNVESLTAPPFPSIVRLSPPSMAWRTRIGG
jgi:hypothetical protein